MRGWRSLSVVVFALVLVAGCHRAKSTGPAWPAPSTTADDGGESIDPHTTAAVALEQSADDEVVDPIAEIVAKPTASPETETEKPPTISPTQPTSDDEVIISEDVIDEIDD